VRQPALLSLVGVIAVMSPYLLWVLGSPGRCPVRTGRSVLPVVTHEPMYGRVRMGACRMRQPDHVYVRCPRVAAQANEAVP